MVTGVHTDKLSAKVTLGAILLAQLTALVTPACQGSDRASDVGAAVSPEASQVKPATGRAPSEPEPLAVPEPEGAELPRGVSAPQPDARLSEARGSSVLKPSSAAPKPSVAVEPSPSSKSKALDAPAPAAAKKPSLASPVSAKPALAQSKPAAPKPPPAPPALAQAVPPEPIAAPVAAAPPPKKVTVTVPQTDHVRVDVPSGLQHWLDEDDRMRPWLSKAINVADSCYAKVRADNPGASGEIAFVVTMHENARPSGKVSSVSSPISGIVMCATTRLLGVKMPLFTGKEGESYTVRVRFEP
jgi:hypothetical protein